MQTSDNSLKQQMFKVKRQLDKDKTKTLILPPLFVFREHGVYDFDSYLSFFDWSIKSCPVVIDLRPCHTANFKLFHSSLLMHGILRTVAVE
jgi:hypothetical protein